MLTDPKLVQGTYDWFLPLKHEAAYWPQFMGGGRTYLDIGAHVGTWCLPLSQRFERVFAFEPDPRAWQTLKANLELNGITNVEVIPKAVSNVKGSIKLNLFTNPCTNTMMDLAACNRLVPHDMPIGVHEVETVTIDDFVAERGLTDVDFIKMDAECAEILIIEGAQKTFSEQNPDFFIEMHGLFWERLREKLPGQNCDIIDCGRTGLSLVKHRDAWPGFRTDVFRVYPHPTAPTHEQMRSLRAAYGNEWSPPAPGSPMSVEYRGYF